MILTTRRKDLGYNYVNVDDCYSKKERNENGDIVEGRPPYYASALLLPNADAITCCLVDPDKFPSGMRTLTDKIHEMGL